MSDDETLRAALQGRAATWELLAENGASSEQAAALRRCGRRTALKELKAAAERLAARGARGQPPSRAGVRSNWPRELREAAALLERSGPRALPASARRRLLAGVPRSIGVARDERGGEAGGEAGA